MTDPTELQPGEVHPAWSVAVERLRGMGLEQQMVWMESLSSCAIEGNRLAEVCAGTLRRIMDGEPVGERYLLGLALVMTGEPR